MRIFEIVVIALYLITLVLTVVSSLGQLHLIINFLRNRRKVKSEPAFTGNDNLPFVTIQLPIYNELYVVERLLESVAAMDYPKDRFEIQLLDDSTDETVEVAARKIAELKARGIQVEHVRRPIRTGFKAGALGYGLDFAKGEYIAIFDADFLPHPNFLRATLPNFVHDRVGVVQARWEHLNKDYSFFTEAQAFHLDAHFTIEQFGRDSGGFFMNFNGTAGVWRKACILDAGGWETDTLTEDLDLSYRAQIKGWQFKYVDEIGAPAELPAEMGAIKSQQYRWMKGGAEVARKMLSTLWKADVPFSSKFHGSLHLLSSSVFMLVLLLGATSVPLLYLKHERFAGRVDFLILPVAALLCSFLILAALYITTCYWREGSFEAAMRRFLRHYIPFLSFSMGLSLHNSIAVIQGLRGKRTPFIRTPKFNVINRSDKWQKVTYKTRKLDKTVYAELALMLYFLFGVYLAIHFRDFSLMPFLLMQGGGFGLVGLYSVRHAFTRA
ncbi:MAG: glycosyltransferase [Bacteroidetes bacterium]|nr:MAG: glycosyltransferase [Bacteroidota bacterium]